MEYFEIHGGKKLSGSIDVRGSKNATTPILAATLLTKEECVISNIPRIEDVFRMIEILEGLGASVAWVNERTIKIKAEDVDPARLDVELVKKLRSSILLLGSLSARFDSFSFHHPGGCVIGKRPVGTHFDALEKMGVEIQSVDEKSYQVDAHGRNAAQVVLKEFSVTATENAMMLAASLPGTTTIKIAAAEPHVEDLGKFLVAMGATIEGLGTHTLKITGATLHGATHEIIPDANEAATFLILGVATKSPIRVMGAREQHLDLVLEKLREFGADFNIEEDAITVIPGQQLKAIEKIDTRTYPGIPTDIQAPLGVLASQAQGETLIFDTLFEGRFNYLSELEKMGARTKILNPHQAIIYGPAKLRGSVIKSYDLRAGASLIIAGLCANGVSKIEEIYQVDRGYEKMEERLQKLGADIKRVTI